MIHISVTDLAHTVPKAVARKEKRLKYGGKWIIESTPFVDREVMLGGI